MTETQVTAEAVSHSLRSDDSARLLALREQLAGDRELSRAVLSELAESKRRADRGIVIGWGRQLLGADVAPLLVKLLDDRDPDVALDAMSELLEIDPALAQPQISRLTRWLRSSDYWKPVQALWILARLGRDEVIPHLERLEANPAYPWHGFEARIARMLLQGNEGEVWLSLRNHTHDSTQHLAGAAYEWRSDMARQALVVCSDSAPDEQCRAICARALAKLNEADSAKP